MRAENFDKMLDLIVRKDPRYHRDAYLFVREALDHTQKLVAKSVRGSAKPEPRHVSGQELLTGIRTCALDQYGPMAFAVLEEWGVRRCEDFGEIVFNLIEYGGGMFVGKSEMDSREDFKAAWNFDEAFRQPFLPAAKKAAKKALSQEQTTS